jgi:hypothetical protein
VSGRNSAVECQLPKLKVAGSSPVARSNKIRWLGKYPNHFFMIGHIVVKNRDA